MEKDGGDSDIYRDINWDERIRMTENEELGFS